MTRETFIFVKILFNFIKFSEKEISLWGKPVNSFNVSENQEIGLNTSCHIHHHVKNLNSPKPTWKSQWSLISSLPSFFTSQLYFRKSSKPGHENLVLVTSTVQVELSKLSFNSDDIRTYFLLFLLAFRSVDIIFHKFSGLHSTLLEKKDFRHTCSFFSRFTQTPRHPHHPLNSQNRPSLTNAFCQCPLTYHGFSRLSWHDDN